MLSRLMLCTEVFYDFQDRGDILMRLTLLTFSLSLTDDLLKGNTNSSQRTLYCIDLEMSEQQGVSSFPLPPMQYISLYTDDHIKRGRVPQPPPPIQDSYMMFGVPFNADDAIIRPLETQGFRRLYPQNYDHKRELKKLNHSILINFLDLLDILIRAPDSPKRTEKLDDMNLLFIHMHHLINEFRPHQARETLRMMMEYQKRQRLEIADKFQKHLDGVKELILKSLQALPDADAMECKAMTSSEILQAKDKSESKPMDIEPCDGLDKIMCDIVDNLS
ncbi:mediator of RNA polymerase II transcription subunit 7-like [Octopus vulgaris]|uniref:Mediator of RNA polymerase II transcription subunit 7 n=3 Tax=Octopus TaxID=6643 RepID=A0AA36FCD1_OCTVU|nr:mediator of RNA polymerase II transcription subunit 7-like [Octopus vulgaris]